MALIHFTRMQHTESLRAPTAEGAAPASVNSTMSCCTSNDDVPILIQVTHCLWVIDIKALAWCTIKFFFTLRLQILRTLAFFDLYCFSFVACSTQARRAKREGRWLLVGDPPPARPRPASRARHA